MAVEQATSESAFKRVSELSVSEQVLQEPEKQLIEIYILTVGFGHFLITPIIEKLLPKKKIAQEPDNG